MILHLFVCLFSIFLLQGCKCYKNSDYSYMIHQCGPVLKTVSGTHYPLNKYLLNKWTNEFCDYNMHKSTTTKTSQIIWKEEKLLFSQTKMVIDPYFWNTWLRGWCLKMNRDISQQALAAGCFCKKFVKGLSKKGEKAVPGKTLARHKQ